MTSKISYFKFIRENIRRRSWLAAVSAILIFSVQTLWTSIRIESLLADSYYSLDLADNTSLSTWVNTTFPGLFNGYSFRPFAILIILLALCCAVSSFSYLHKTEETDFFHSLPLKRGQLFFISYSGGLLIFLLPYLLASIATLSVSFAMGIGAYIPLGQCLFAMFGCILGFFIFYNTSILAMMLTGKLISGVLASLVCFVYIKMISQLFGSLPSLFWDTYHANANALSYQIARFLSPLSIYSNLLTQTAFTEKNMSSSTVLLSLVIALVYSAVVGGLAYFFYLIRPSEASGNALSHPHISGWIKCFATVPAALTIGLFFSTFFGNVSPGWTILISMLSVVILCGITEFIYHTDLRQIIKGKGSSLFSVLCVAGILCILHFDLFGFNTWIPEKNDLKSISVTANSFSNYFSDPYMYEPTKYTDPLDHTGFQITDPSSVLTLAKEGIENYKKGLRTESIVTENVPDYMMISIRFTKKLGQPIYRDYVVSKNSFLNTLETVCKNENYRKELFPVFRLDTEKISSVNLIDIYQLPQTLTLSPEQKNVLLDAYKKDLLLTDIHTLQEEYPIAELSLQYPPYLKESNYISSQDYRKDLLFRTELSQLYIYKNFENTLAVLTEYGYTIQEKILPEDIREIRLEQSSDNTETPEMSLISDPDQIQQILDQIHYSCSGILGGKDTSVQYAQITMENSPYPLYYPIQP